MSNNQKGNKKKKVKDSGRGIIKAVNSGDSVVILELEKAYNGPPPEREIYFSMLNAPRLGRRGANDAPWAWESREFLRELCIGKSVSFEIDFKTETGREFGVVSLSNGLNLLKEVVSNGYAQVRRPKEGRDPKDDLHEELIQLDEAAEQKKVGLYSEGKPIKRNVISSYSSIDLFNKLKKKESHDAILEWVRDGSTMRILFPSSFHNVLIKLSGCESPNIPPPGKQQQPEPFAREAKFFSERYLLHRNVEFFPTGMGLNDEIYGIIKMGGKSLAEELLRAGLARYIEWHAPADLKERYQASEKHAQDNKLRLWRNVKVGESSRSNSNNNDDEFTGKVCEIHNGGQLLVLDTTQNPSVKKIVALSSIRVPYLKTGQDNEPYAYEAKELLRKRLIGKKVTCRLDYVNTNPNTKKEREYYSVFLDKTNVACLLLSRGLGKVLNHKDNNRSPSYDQLILTEKTAKSKSKGIWKKNASSSFTYTDLTLRDEDKAAAIKKQTKNFLPFLKKAGRVPGVVEFVFNSSSIKILVPKETVMVVFVLEGIKGVSTNNNSNNNNNEDDNNKVAENALEYVRSKIHQRDVDIIVSSLDKNNRFIGNLFINKKNLSEMLLEKGYAKVFGPAAQRSNYKDQLYAAEQRAKDSKVGIWKNYDEEAERQKQLEAAAAKENNNNNNSGKKWHQVVVTEICDGGWFYCRTLPPVGPSEFDTLMNDIQQDAESSNANPNFKPSVNTLVYCNHQNKFHRAHIDNIEGNDYFVFFPDVGSASVVSQNQLRPINDKNIQNKPPLAKESFLAYLSIPPLEEEFGEEAADHLEDITKDKILMANIEYQDEDRWNLNLADPKTTLNINVDMVKSGFGFVNKQSPTYHNKQLVKELYKLQEEAHKAHLNIWKYGDVTPDF
eukprot:TRINITY_DN2529_c1_g2_i1.p1 TRINITY_DN2529_c1_g2~~TRINITY_DN2529_c1_g2_i1.p1  ORF type:complete len:894 (+),score=381.65 TRINITY_DN2529_c1_g2_i1:126-2807(+)